MTTGDRRALSNDSLSASERLKSDGRCAPLAVTVPSAAVSTGCCVPYAGKPRSELLEEEEAILPTASGRHHHDGVIQADSVVPVAAEAEQPEKEQVEEDEDAIGHGAAASSADAKVQFGLTVEQLLEIQGEANVTKLNDLGGVPLVCKALGVNPHHGIPGTPDDLKKRTEEFGNNTYPEQPQKPFLMFAWEAAHDLTLIILMVCAAIALVAGMVTDGPSHGWHDGVAIAVAVVIVILVTAISNYRQSLQFRGLNAEKSNIQLKVLRDERVQTVSIFTLVVGDIIPLATGDQVPADGLVVSGHSLTIDESSMTGESDPMHKDSKHPFLVSGCKVVDGFGTMVATAVGINTEWGRVMATLNHDNESETPLQARLKRLATTIGKIGITCAILVFVVEIVRYFALVYYYGMAATQVVLDIVDMFTVSVTIIVVAVPEGLPLAVTLTLAYSMHKMMADKALVRHLAACETMGSATTICSDKTGTLTLNQMTVVQEWHGGSLHEVQAQQAINQAIKDLLFEGIALNSTASVFIPHDGGEPQVTSSPTETAVTKWALNLGLQFNGLRESVETLAVETFNSTKKVGGACVKRPDGAVAVHWKGAAEIIVDRCTKVMDSNGNAVDLDEAQKAKAMEAISSMATHSLRCIGLATAVVPPGDVPQETEGWKFPDTELTLLAIVGIKDPCRPGVPDAVAKCQSAGVKVRMVTGDNVNTARAIAGECGILTPNGRVVEGKDFRVMTKEQIQELLPSLDVMARSSPSDKHMLVQALRAQGEVVAVTGDGTNDGPALHEADIGLSMGLSGTEVAKESSDIVILDDNFTSIVKVVSWGRSVFANIQKYIQFQLTVNVVALSINLISAATSGDIPLQTVQLLWVNLIMNTMGALALATEPPTADLLEQEPIGRTAPIISNVMWRNIFGQAAYQLSILLVLHYKGIDLLNLSGYPDPTRVNNSIIFNAFVFCQIFNEFNSRRPTKLNAFEGIHRNPIFLFIIVVSCSFQVVIIELLPDFAKSTSLTLQQWAISIAIGFIGMPLAIVLKLIPVQEKPLFDFLKRIRFRSRGKDTPPGPTSASGIIETGATTDEEAALKAPQAGA